ncbi:MAG: hypothetical protein Ct9H300mP1_00260 [Planctomycetaceae bacterium]|nr:MAG: hypothetical protein Ct9H300mP1_00260 [Planctomycetaceae bacterium]
MTPTPWAPKISVPSPAQASEQAQLASAIASAEKPLAEHDRKFAAGMPAWEKRLASIDAGSFTTLKPAKWPLPRGPS